MKRPIRIYLALWLAVMTLAGCVRPAPQEHGGATQLPPAASVAAGAEDSQPRHAATAARPPIVRVIKGTPVDGLEDAYRKLARQSEGGPRGLQERLRSLSLKGVQVRALAELLTEICGYNVVATNQVAEQEVTVYLKNLSLREALESISRLNNIWYREGQGIITLMTREEYVRDLEVRQSDQTRAFYIRYTNAADMAKVIQAAMGSEVHLAVIEDEKIYGHIDPEEQATVTTGAARSPALTLRTQTLAESGEELPPAALDAAVGAAAGGRSAGAGSRPQLAILTVFKRNNAIVARSLDGGLLNEMARIIEALDTPTSQVLLEIKILQLNLGNGFESFFNINYTSGSLTAGLGGSTLLGATTLDVLFDSARIDARIRYFMTQGRGEIISTPFLMAANNSRVEFFVGEETPLRDEVTTTTVPIGEQGDTLTTFNVKIERKELGTKVEMMTFINEDGTVTLDFNALISSPLLAFSTIPVVNPQTGQVINFPIDGTSKSELKSILTAQSGQSIAIGGIIRESLDLTENKVPILGDIPGLGFFFKELNHSKRKTETVIVLTPRVINHPALGEGVSDAFLRGRSSHRHINPGLEQILVNPTEASFKLLAPEDRGFDRGEQP